MAGAKLLLVEDDRDLRELLARGLGEEGFDVRAVALGGDALRSVREREPDAMVIDIGLPDTDGRDVCLALRAAGSRAPVLFLTARDAVTDRLAGFEAGGDDYVVKPFAFEEIVARLHALVRRAGVDTATELGSLRLDPVAHSVTCGERSIDLTPTEFRLLAGLAARPRENLTRRRLLATAWPAGAMVHDNTLDVYMARLRRKLRDCPGAPAIVTVPRVGYRLE
ncbi:MAG: response regulator transcription factor [Thermoleophilaceae bacterium]